MSYQVRNYQFADFPHYHQLVVDIRKTLISSYLPSKEFLWKNLQRPHFHPEKDLLLAETEEKLIGFLEINSEPKINRAIMDGGVLPSQRNKGVANSLLEHGIKRAQEIGAKKIHFNISPNNYNAKKLLNKNQFSMVRQFWEMKAALTPKNIFNPKMKDERINSRSLKLRHMHKGEEAKLANLQNHCFSETWGFQPNTAEDIVFRLNMYDASPENILMVTLNNKPVAYCWTLFDTTQKISHILMLGVSPANRGKGLGKYVLSAGMRYLKNKGIPEVILTADASNQAALKLYRSLGFHKKYETWWYELSLDYW